MTNTGLLAKGNPVKMGPNQVGLAQLDLTPYRAIRLSVSNWVHSPTSVIITVVHIDQPGTPNANAITTMDTFTLAPGDSTSKVYDVPGEVVAINADPDQAQVSGINVFFTVYGRAD